MLCLSIDCLVREPFVFIKPYQKNILWQMNISDSKWYNILSTSEGNCIETHNGHNCIFMVKWNAWVNKLVVLPIGLICL